MTSVWALVYSNYEPAEVDSLWATEELARKREAKLGEAAGGSSMWRVVEWSVGTEESEE
jgi:hypothetical protein